MNSNKLSDIFPEQEMDRDRSQGSFCENPLIGTYQERVVLCRSSDPGNLNIQDSNSGSLQEHPKWHQKGNLQKPHL